MIPSALECFSNAQCNVKAASDSAGVTSEIVKDTNYVQIASYRAMSNPALVIDEKTVSVGKVLSVSEVAEKLAAS